MTSTVPNYNLILARLYHVECVDLTGLPFSFSEGRVKFARRDDALKVHSRLMFHRKMVPPCFKPYSADGTFKGARFLALVQIMRKLKKGGKMSTVT